MKRILSIILLCLVSFTIGFTRPALATDAANGAKIFNANCTTCHMGGRNVVVADKTLEKNALEKNNMNSIEAIVNQVTNGKSAMPSFKGKLDAQQIKDVAAYVLEKSEKGWS